VAVGRLLRGGSAVALIAALDAVREIAARGESRTAVRHAFILALTEREAQPVRGASAEDVDTRQAEAEALLKEVGPDAFLLYRLSDEREALAADAAGIDLAEEAQARVDVSSLRGLAVRHAIHHARRDTAGRAPWVEEPATAETERGGSGA
jgi:sarcosine oxidase gamma subunit